MIRIYEESKNEEVDVYLKLEYSCCGDINLIACNKGGDELSDSLLLYFKPTGQLMLPRGISEDLGFITDSFGHLVPMKR